LEGKGRREENHEGAKMPRERLSSPFEVCGSTIDLIGQLHNPRAASQNQDRKRNRLEHDGEMRRNRRV